MTRLAELSRRFSGSPAQRTVDGERNPIRPFARQEHINVLTGCHFSLFADHGPDHVAYRIGCNSRNDVALPIRRWALDVRCWKFVPCVLALGG